MHLKKNEENLKFPTKYYLGCEIILGRKDQLFII